MASLPLIGPVGAEAAVEAAPAKKVKVRRLPRSVRLAEPVLTRRERKVVPKLEQVYRGMYTALFPNLTPTTSAVIGVTSAVRGEGRTTTALGIALGLAKDLDVRVILIEADLDHPSLADKLGFYPGPGLAQVLVGKACLDEAVCPLPEIGLSIVPAGEAAVSTSRLLRSQALQEMIQRLRSPGTITIVDMPPALASPDVVPLSLLVDDVVLVVRSGVTPMKMIEESISLVGQERIRGMVLNAQRSKIPQWLRKFI
ncbi:MAG: CpsD/CapB family tyrosine-protein kinase [Chloroflexi bacterium]|nr:CpsD/CapB family tyrosine-protein kinase [Chloroflexota bacterium]